MVGEKIEILILSFFKIEGVVSFMFSIKRIIFVRIIILKV